MDTLLYARTSTDEQENGLEAQADALWKAAGIHGWDAKLLSEHASGKTMARRVALLEALEALDGGRASRLVVTNLSRLTRSVADFSSILDRAQKGPWSLVVLDLGGGGALDTSSAAGRLAARMLMEVMMWEREAISERTRAGLKKAKEKGARLGRPSTVPPDVRAQVKTLRTQGLSTRAIASRLNSEAVPGPAGEGSTWYSSSVSRVLRRA
jgi:DNA invertase Pin-like site-specific DNA recombinase